MLDDIVTELIHRQYLDVLYDLRDYRSCLKLLTILKDALDNSAPIRVFAHLYRVLSHRFDDELDSSCRHLFNALLNDMVAILVKHAFHDVIFEFINK